MTVTSQTSLQYKPRSFPSNFGTMVYGILTAELRLRWRDPGTAVLIVVLAALTQVLTPGSEASYAIISVHGAKPIMSVDTNLVAVAVVLATILFPINLMMLGLGVRRDAIRGLNDFHWVMPVSGVAFNLGRVLASGFTVLGYTLVFLLLLMLSDQMKQGSLPSGAAISAFTLISLTAGLAALGISVILDRFIFSPVKRILGAFIVWMAVILNSIFGSQDILGYDLLRANLAPDSTEVPISIGITSAAGLQKIDWPILLVPADWVTHHMLLLMLTGFCAILLAMVVGKASPKTIISSTTPQSETNNTKIAISGPVSQVPVSQVMVSGTAGMLMTARLLCGRWLQGRRYALAFLGTGSILAVTGADLNVTVAVVLLFPVFILCRSRPGLDQSSFNMSLAALWRPTPSVFTLLILTVILLIPLVPALIMLPFQQALHLCLSSFCAAAWLVLSCIIWGRTQLGVSVYVLLWYGLVANEPPYVLDLFGVRSSQPWFFIVTLATAIILLIAVAMADQRPKKIG